MGKAAYGKRNELPAKCFVGSPPDWPPEQLSKLSKAATTMSVAHRTDWQVLQNEASAFLAAFFLLEFLASDGLPRASGLARLTVSVLIVVRFLDCCLLESAPISRLQRARSAEYSRSCRCQS